MKKAVKNRRKPHVHLEDLEPRRMLAPVGIADYYSVDEDTLLNHLPVQELVFPAGSEWLYLDDGTDQGEAWREPGFDDGDWESGFAQLGYGDGDEETVISDGGDPNDVIPTYYFRKHFEVTADDISSLFIELQRDDGAAVYLNGQEIIRDNLQQGAEFDDYANDFTGNENAFLFFQVDASSLVVGDNVLAVEIHQSGPDSSDVSFDMQVTASRAGSTVLDNDTNEGGGPLTAQLVSETQNGIMILNEDGSFGYLPNADFHGTDSFVYRATDGIEFSNEVTVTIQVNSVNDLPIAEEESFHAVTETLLEVPQAFGLLNNDFDVEGGPLTAVLETDVSHGTLVLNDDGTFQYTSEAGYAGVDSFVYVAHDGTDPSLPVTVRITVTLENDPPIVTADSYSVDEDGTLVIDLPSIPQPTEVFYTDFESGIPPEFFGPAELTDVQDFAGLGNDGNVFSGQFLRNSANSQGGIAPGTGLFLTNLPRHDAIDIRFLLGVLDDWDGAQGFRGPDFFNITVDGITVFSETLNSENPGDQTYRPPVDGELAGDEDLFGNDNDFESAYDMYLEPALQKIPHSESTVFIEWYGSGQGYRRNIFGGPETESFALDNVSILVSQGAVGEITQRELVLPGAIWSYLDDGSDQGTAWREPGFDDSGWDTGPSQLGYGDGDEQTVVGFGGDPFDVYPTTYFRHTFDSTALEANTHLELFLSYDDGAAVYLNGTEIVRENLQPGADFSDYADTTTQSEGVYFSFLIDSDLIIEGENVLAVEVHQANGSSSDLSMDLALFATIEEGGAQGDFGVLGNDSDVGGGPLLAELVSGTSHGTLEFHQDGTFVYTPEPNYFGTDSFTYRAMGLTGNSATATATITVNPGPNEPALVQDKEYSLNEDQPLSVSSENGLLVGAEDEDNDPLMAVLASPPQHGQVSILGDGSFVYVPDADFFGTDSFTFVANDTQLDSLEGTVTLTIAPVADAPRATGELYFIEPGGSIDVPAGAGVLANDLEVDGQAITAVLVDDAPNGTLVLNADGSFTYSPNPGYTSTDSFTYQADDGDSLSEVVTVLLTVDAQPVSQDDDYSVAEDQLLTVDATTGVVANDSDGEDDPLTVILVQGPAHGQLTLNTDGSFEYLPELDYFGDDTFSYLVNDGDQDSQVAEVTVTVTPVNDAPVGVDDDFGVVRNGIVTVTADQGVLFNDIDVDSAQLTVQLVGDGPTNGTLTELNADGSFTYEPTEGFLGDDFFSYVVSDGLLESAPATVRISVTDPAEDIVINEIMYHPSSEDVREEYIELHNRGLGLVTVTGWRITRGVDFTFPEAMIEPGGYLVIAADVDAFRAEYGDVDNLIGGWTGQLSNNAESIEIETADGTRVDIVDYADSGAWALRRQVNDGGEQGWDWQADHDGGGSSVELINPAAPNRTGENWASSTGDGGTPGRVNSVHSTESAPLIREVKHRPVVPQVNEPVTITAEVSDDGDGEMTVELFHRVSTMQPGPFESTPMFDDGMHGDGEAGDGTFGAILPGRPDDTVTEFYVRAEDDQGNSRTWPAPTDGQGNQGANALFQVDTESYDGGQPIYRVVMTAQEAQSLQTNNRQSDAQMNGTFINFDGTGFDVRYNIGIRYRGNGTRQQTPTNYRINFPGDQPWQGVDAINMNSQYPHGQVLGMTLFELAGLAAEDANAAQIRLNGIQYATTPAQQGSYVRLEVTNSQWADNHYPDDSGGNLYRGTNGRLTYSTNINNYRNQYNKQTNESEDDWSDLIALTAALDNGETPDGVFMETLEQVADVDQWMRFLAVNALLVNEENGLINGNGDDYSLFCGVVDPRCLLLPHDMDTIFAEGDGSANQATITRDIFEPRNLPAFDRILDVPEYLNLYYFHLRDLATTVFSDEQLQPLMDNLLGAWVAPDLLNEMKDFASARVDYVLSQIPANLILPPVATIDGEPPAVTHSDQATLTVAGDNVVQYRFRINGGAYSAIRLANNPITLGGLEDGEYTVEVIGINSAGTEQKGTTLSRTWRVDSGYSDLIINEVLALNNTAYQHQGTYPDAIELYNRGDAPIDLSGMTITDDLDTPDRYTFADGLMLGPGEYLVLLADSGPSVGGEIRLGFSLSSTGEGIYLFSSQDAGGELLDQVEFGIQLANMSIGRMDDFHFTLNQPTLGQANVAVALEDASMVVINEWLADSDGFQDGDFFELYNPALQPIAIGGMYVTDSPIGRPARHQIAPLSFMAARGFQTFYADDDEDSGADHVNFNLNANRDSVAIRDRNLKLIDMVVIMPQSTDISQGRRPDGFETFGYMSIPTPGARNIDRPLEARILEYLRVTEIMYNPPASTFELEFLELQNTGPAPILLDGIQVGGGIDFTFPTLTPEGGPARILLAAGEYIVLVNDLESFQDIYGDQVRVGGEYSGNLSNGGEEIWMRLPAPLNYDIQRFEYDDNVEEGWPAEADNGGYSLVIVDPQGDYNDPANWRASDTVGGSPGRLRYEFVQVNDVNFNAGFEDPDDLPHAAQPTSWAEQRSDLRSIQVSFNFPVNVTHQDLVLTNLGVNASDEEDVVIPLTEDHISVNGNELLISFASQELPDGVYQLEILSTITGAGGQIFDGNGDGVGGDAYTLTGDTDNLFYVLTGDWNADQGVSIFDFSAFTYWFGYGTDVAPDYLDLYDDDGISIFDFTEFAEQFGASVSFPDPGLAQATPLSAVAVDPRVDAVSSSDEAETIVPQQSPAGRTAVLHDAVFQRVYRNSETAGRDADARDSEDLEVILDRISDDVFRAW